MVIYASNPSVDRCFPYFFQQPQGFPMGFRLLPPFYTRLLRPRCLIRCWQRGRSWGHAGNSNCRQAVRNYCLGKQRRKERKKGANHHNSGVEASLETSMIVGEAGNGNPPPGFMDVCSLSASGIPQPFPNTELFLDSQSIEFEQSFIANP